MHKRWLDVRCEEMGAKNGIFMYIILHLQSNYTDRLSTTCAMYSIYIDHMTLKTLYLFVRFRKTKATASQPSKFNALRSL